VLEYLFGIEDIVASIPYYLKSGTYNHSNSFYTSWDSEVLWALTYYLNFSCQPSCVTQVELSQKDFMPYSGTHELVPKLKISLRPERVV
jgi:hypothetical protein